MSGRCRYNGPRVIATIGARPAGPAVARYRPRWRRGPRAVVVHVVLTTRPRPRPSRAPDTRVLGVFVAVVLGGSVATSAAAVAACVAVAALVTDDPLGPVPLGFALVAAGLLTGASAWWATPLVRRITLWIVRERG